MSESAFDLDAFHARASAQHPGTVFDLSNTRLELVVLDQIDGVFVTEARFVAEAPDGSLGFMQVTRANGLRVALSGGDASMEHDPGTEHILIRPKSATPVHADAQVRATVGAQSTIVASGNTLIGISPHDIPLAQQSVLAGGGGACASVATLTGDYRFELRVRSRVNASVIPRTAVDREINWRNALYYAHDAKLGLMRLHYNPARVSITRLRSDAPERGASADSFFPASGTNSLFFVLEFADLGIRAFNKEPMNLPFSHAPWPPYADPLRIDRPVDFYDFKQPDRVILQVLENEMQLYDYSGIDVECLKFDVSADGRLTSLWKISNTSDENISGRWFALGDAAQAAGAEGKRFEGNHDLRKAGTAGSAFEIALDLQLKQSTLPQRISMNFVSLGDPVLLGGDSIRPLYPPPE